MNYLYHERRRRGTDDFPLELYEIDISHPRYRMQAHWHREYEIIHVTEGTLYLTVNEKPLTLQASESVFIPGGVLHSAVPERCRYECLVFLPSVLYCVPRCRTLTKTKLQKTVRYRKHSGIAHMFAAMQEKGCGFEAAVIGELYLLAADMMQKNVGDTVQFNEKLEKVKAAMEMIEENYASKVTLPDLAQVCGLSPNYFCRYFKEITGQTPFEYITVYRIEAACEMLLAGEMSVTEVCFACGFNDLSYFIRIFKKIKGQTPRAYRG